LAFLRFSRDKRGYEHFYLVEATTNRRGKTRARVLYWFRTPPGVKVGREPFDADVRQALEAQNPGVVFDWRKISETPIPSADAERWRERRRVEKAERAARKARAADDEPDSDDAAGEGDAESAEMGESFDAVGGDDESTTPTAEAPAAPDLTGQADSPAHPDSPAQAAAHVQGAAHVQPAAAESRRRRRRRRSRGSRGSNGSRGSSGSEGLQSSQRPEGSNEPLEPEPLEPLEPHEPE